MVWLGSMSNIPVKVYSNEGGQWKMVANWNSNAISQMAYTRTNGNLCHLADGIRRKGVNLQNFTFNAAMLDAMVQYSGSN